MNDAEKLRVLLPHWIEHTDEHAEEFRRWASLVQPAQEALTAAAQLLQQAGERLQEVLNALGGALPRPHDHAHSHDQPHPQ